MLLARRSVKPGGAALRPLSPCPRCGKVPTFALRAASGRFRRRAVYALLRVPRSVRRPGVSRRGHGGDRLGGMEDEPWDVKEFTAVRGLRIGRRVYSAASKGPGVKFYALRQVRAADNAL